MENLESALQTPPKNSECVVLIHGLTRSSLCLKKAAKLLEGYGYKTFVLQYPSRKLPIEQLVDRYMAPAMTKISQYPFKKIHFLTHSMGAILLRYYLTQHQLSNLGRSVMLAPPNRGSEIVDKLQHLKLFYLLNGPAGRQLGTTSECLPVTLGKINFETGILTGNKSFNPLLSLLISGENDGKVSIENARISGMTDFMVVPHTHIFIMQRKPAILQALYFIQHGLFYRPE